MPRHIYLSHYFLMEALNFTPVEVFYLVQDGRTVAYSPSESEIRQQIPGNDAGFEIVFKSESAGIVKGEVLDWSKRGGHSFTPKLHWNCPQCGQQWWEELPTPILAARAVSAFAGGGCIGIIRKLRRS